MKYITVKEMEDLQDSLDVLKEVLLKVGITELKISKQSKEIFLDTDSNGFNSEWIGKFSEAMHDLYFSNL